MHPERKKAETQKGKMQLGGDGQKLETETVFCDDLKIWHPRA